MASSPERSRQVAEEWGVEQAYANIDEVADSDAEIVHICTPNASHVPYAVGLDGGRQARAVREAAGGRAGGRPSTRAQVAGDTGVVNTIPFAYRFHPMAREMRARVQDEELRRDQPDARQLSAGLAARPQRHQLAGRSQGGRTVAGVRRHRLALVRSGRVGER